MDTALNWSMKVLKKMQIAYQKWGRMKAPVIVAVVHLSVD